MFWGARDMIDIDMGDHIRIEVGRKPWQPTDDAEVLSTYDFHDFPLAGLVQQHGSMFGFWCVDGRVGDSNVWAYVWISEQDRQGLETAEDPYIFLEALVLRRQFVIALAHRSKGIVETALIDSQTELKEYLKALLTDVSSNESDWPLLKLAASG
jgi:hypothetical protein